jgi:hypothetical protein
MTGKKASLIYNVVGINTLCTVTKNAQTKRIANMQLVEKISVDDPEARKTILETVAEKVHG